MRKLDIKEIQAMQLELMKKLHAFLDENSIRYYLIAGSALGAVRHEGFIPWDDDIDIGLFREDYEKFLSIKDKFDTQYEIANFKTLKVCGNCLTRVYFKNTFLDNPFIRDTELDKRMFFDVFPLDNVPNDTHEFSVLEKRIAKLKRLIALSDVRYHNITKLKLIHRKAQAFILKPFRNHMLNKQDNLMKKYAEVETECVCSMCSQYSFKKQTMPKAYYGTPVLKKFEDSVFYVPEMTDKYLEHLYGPDYMQLPPENKRRKSMDVYIVDEVK